MRAIAELRRYSIWKKARLSAKKRLTFKIENFHWENVGHHVRETIHQIEFFLLDELIKNHETSNQRDKVEPWI